MLHTKTVKRETLELLKELAHDPELSGFNLAGGTALALYLSHRISIDLALFTPQPFDVRALEDYLIRQYDFHGDFLEKNTLKGSIQEVKIDCITHNYPYINAPFISSSGIRLYSMEDIAAMKLSAIADNGTRLKDFIDIACLSVKLPLQSMLDAYQTKYQNSNSLRALKGLNFWEDILFNEPIQMIGGIYKWDKIEKRLYAMMKNTEKVFPDFPLAQEKRKQLKPKI